MDRDDRVMRYMQQRMTVPEKASFELELARDATLSDEVAMLRVVRTTMAGQKMAGQGAEGSNCAEAGWKQLRTTITTEPPNRIQSHEASSANVNGPIRMSIAQAACFAVAAVLAWQFLVPDFGGEIEQPFVPAAQTSAEIRLQVAFQSDASIGDIAQRLDQLGGTIVSGPGAIGLFEIAFANSERRDAAFEALALEDALVSFVGGVHQP